VLSPSARCPSGQHSDKEVGHTCGCVRLRESPSWHGPQQDRPAGTGCRGAGSRERNKVPVGPALTRIAVDDCVADDDVRVVGGPANRHAASSRFRGAAHTAPRPTGRGKRSAHTMRRTDQAMLALLVAVVDAATGERTARQRIPSWCRRHSRTRDRWRSPEQHDVGAAAASEGKRCRQSSAPMGPSGYECAGRSNASRSRDCNRLWPNAGTDASGLPIVAQPTARRNANPGKRMAVVMMKTGGNPTRRMGDGQAPARRDGRQIGPTRKPVLGARPVRPARRSIEQQRATRVGHQRPCDQDSACAHLPTRVYVGAVRQMSAPFPSMSIARW